MGNTQANGGRKKPLIDYIDFIASNYILTQSFTDLQELADPDYCDKLIIITSDVFDKYLSESDVHFLFQKMQQGVPINEIKRDNLVYLRKEDINKLDVPGKTSKKRKCKGIAKFYIKIAHIFGAILTTVNPTYSYTDDGEHTVSFSEKNTIPDDVDIKLNKINLCSERVNALVNGEQQSISDSGQPIKIKPNFCQMNMKQHDTAHMGVKVNKTLGDEPGIAQLDKLYNDIYDYDAGKFLGKSKEMKEKYNKDLQALYTAFTGKQTLPKDITSFTQIPLRDFRSLSGCQGAPNNQYMQEYIGDSSNKLFNDYVKHVREMMASAEEDRGKLTTILDQIFVYGVNPATKKAEISINPKLSDSMLDKIVVDTQILIMSLYVSCEEKFIKGLQIFEKIIEEKMKKQEEAKIKKMREESKLGKI